MASIYDILNFPFVYNLAQKILAPGGQKFCQKIFREILGESVGTIVDVGCGPRPNGILPGSGVLIGLDINPAYLEDFKKHSNFKNTEVVCGSAFELPFADDTLDECRTFAVLHHLPDDEVIRTLQEMIRTTKKNGRIVVFDPVFPRNYFTRPIAALIFHCDRGRYVRKQEHFVNLLNKIADNSWKITRFSYTYNGLEGLLATYIKN